MIDLGLNGKIVRSVVVEYALRMQLSDVHVVVIESPFTIYFHGHSISLSPDEDPDDAFRPLRQLIGQTVEEATSDATGVLDVRFGDGTRVEVQPDPAFEAWSVSGPDGTLVVCTPRGELAIWSGRERDASSEAADSGHECPEKSQCEIEQSMDSSFPFLGATEADLLNEILTRRDLAVLVRIQRAATVSRDDADQIMCVLSEELTDNLDDDWEPTEYGRTVSALIAQFNTARINEWP